MHGVVVLANGATTAAGGAPVLLLQWFSMNSKAPTAVGPSHTEGRHETRAAMKSELHIVGLLAAVSIQPRTESGGVAVPFCAKERVGRRVAAANTTVERARRCMMIDDQASKREREIMTENRAALGR